MRFRQYAVVYTSICHNRVVSSAFFLGGGMTGVASMFSTLLMISSVSYPLSAKRKSASNPSIRQQASAQSALVPSVIETRTGKPSASTAKCILVLSPLLCGSLLGCLQPPQPHVDEPYNGLHQSSAIQSPAPPSTPPAGLPTRHDPAIGKICVVCFSSDRNPVGDRARVRLCGVSKRPR